MQNLNRLPIEDQTIGRLRAVHVVRQGFAAAMRGEGIAYNPYSLDDPRWNDWNDGVLEWSEDR